MQHELPPNLRGYNAAAAIAKSNDKHSFSFTSDAAYKALHVPFPSQQMEEALGTGCRMIAKGKSALWADMQAHVAEGPHFER